MHLFRKIIITASFFLACFNAKAWWGLTGHRIVGEIAFTLFERESESSDLQDPRNMKRSQWLPIGPISSNRIRQTIIWVHGII